MSTETKIDVAALRALLAKATPRPWEVREHDGSESEHGHIEAAEGSIATVEYGEREDADALLIAAAVNALPALLDAVEGAGGLVFVCHEPTATLRALSEDGGYYEIEVNPDVCFDVIFDADVISTHDTEAEAIEAARAHDRARRGSR